MKRYFLFTGADHSPQGGWDDFYGSYDTPEEARLSVKTFCHNWSHIIDSTTGKRVSGKYCCEEFDKV